MPSEAPISGFATPGLVGVDAFAGSVNDRPVVAMGLGVPSGVAGPGDEAILSNAKPMGERTKRDIQGVKDGAVSLARPLSPCCAPSTTDTECLWLVSNRWLWGSVECNAIPIARARRSQTSAHVCLYKFRKPSIGLMEIDCLHTLHRVNLSHRGLSPTSLLICESRARTKHLGCVRTKTCYQLNKQQSLEI